MTPPTLPRLTAIYLRIASFTFGGGDPTMAALQTELVRRRGWLSMQTYGLVYALARITPGTNMLAFIAGSAWTIAGWTAAVAAVLAATVPPATIVVMLSAGYDSLRSRPRAMAAIGGTLAAAVGMMAAGAWQLLEPQFRSRRGLRIVRAVAFSGAALALALGLHVAPVIVLALAAAVGMLWPGAAES